MRLTAQPSGSHLGYCTNIHAGEQWSELFPLLQRYVPQVKQRISPDHDFGLGLRASMASITALQDPSSLAQFKDWLQAENVYVFTINGFPYGAFHGEQVKALVYRPDWSETQRLSYTCAIADTLAALSPPDNYGSISTVPGTFRQWNTAEKTARIVHNLLQCVAHCVSIKQRTDVTIAVALEPEPACMLETVDDVVNFFQTHLYVKDTIQALAKLCDCNLRDAEAALRTHLGVCYDICHAAVEFEDPLHAIRSMEAAGIPLVKLQLSSALSLPHVNTQTLKSLEQFDEPVYLHQVVEQHNGTLTRYNDLPMAIAAYEQKKTKYDHETQWRVHFHVPVFLDTLEHFGTTQAQLAAVLEAHAQTPLAPHLEVETYTWDVLPDQYKVEDVGQAIARELNWVSQRLSQ